MAYQPSANVKNAINAIDQHLVGKILQEYTNSIMKINTIWDQKGFDFSYYIDGLKNIVNSMNTQVGNSQQLAGKNDTINSYAVAYVKEQIKPKLTIAVKKLGEDTSVANFLISESVKELNNAKKNNQQILKNIK